MIDTVVLHYNVTVDNKLLYNHWRKQTNQKSKYYLPFYKLDFTFRNGSRFQFTYYPHDYTGKPLLEVEYSLPMAVFGNNIQMVTDLEEAISTANSELSEIKYIPSITVEEGILFRLDICYNHQVRDHVSHYLNALKNLDYPHKKTIVYQDNEVSYNTKNDCIKFYCKFSQCKKLEAYGILRQEHTLRKQEIDNAFGKKNLTLKDINFDKVVDILEEDLKKVGLFGNRINTPSRIIESLCWNYGTDAGIYYYGLLCLHGQVNKKYLPFVTKLHPKSLDRRLQKIKEIGLPLTMSIFLNPLPPLRIDRSIYRKDGNNG